MKKTVKSTITAVYCAVVIAAMGFLPTANAATLQDIEATWGSPAAVVKMDNGAEKRYYKYQNTMDVGYRTFLIQDGAVIDNGTTGWLPSAPVGQASLPESKLGISKAYYANNQTTVAEVEQAWGKPAAVKNLNNGKEERYYKYQNTMDIGYRTFLIQDGKVITSGSVGSLPSVPVGQASLPESKLGISKASYANHPTTVAEVERVWGKPAAVKNLDNGKEERSYKYQNTMDIGYRTFLIQDGKVIADGTSR